MCQHLGEFSGPLELGMYVMQLPDLIEAQPAF